MGEEAFAARAPGPAIKPHGAAPPASGDVGVLACPAHDPPGAGPRVVSIPAVDVLDSQADHETPQLSLEGSDAVIDLDSLSLAHHGASGGRAGGLRTRVDLEGA